MSFDHNQPEYRISELAAHIKRAVEDQFGYVRVRGEISKCGVNASSGHAYITLKDDSAVLEAVCWRGTMAKLTHKPEVGMEVIASGKITTYAGRSTYQLVIESLEPAGQGALMAMLEARKKTLAAEGLFNAARKKAIPFLPQTIGIITSPTGAVIRDMLHRISDRFPRHVLLWPVAVQGAGAAEQIAAAIHGFNTIDTKKFVKPDLIIVARGGGSVEDLWAFNEEIVVRAVAASEIPLISAVGHETDTTLIDYAADLRAPTPTAAAEHAVPVRRDLLYTVEEHGLSLKRSLHRVLDSRTEKLANAQHALARFPRRLEDNAQKLDDYSTRLAHAPLRCVHAKESMLQAAAAALKTGIMQHRLKLHEHAVNTLSDRLRQAVDRPLKQAAHRLEVAHSKLALLDVKHVLSRGFALVRGQNNRLIPSLAHAQQHASLSIEFHDGMLQVGAHKAPSAPHKKPAKKAHTPQQESLF